MRGEACQLGEECVRLVGPARGAIGEAERGDVFDAAARQDERLLEGGVMRVLGGSRRQLRLAQASEFLAIGLLAGLVAAIAASVLSGVIADRVFDLPYRPDWGLAAVGSGVGMLAALAAGLFATRRVLDAPPSVTLRELQG